MSLKAGRSRGYVEQRSSGLWRAVVYAGVDPLTGKEHRLRESAPTKKAAQAALARLQTKVDEGRHARSGMTMGELLDQWLEVSRTSAAPGPATATSSASTCGRPSAPRPPGRSTRSCSSVSTAASCAAGRLVATEEVLGLHVGPDGTMPFPEAVATELDAAVARSGTPHPDGAGRSVLALR